MNGMKAPECHACICASSWRKNWQANSPHVTELFFLLRVLFKAYSSHLCWFPEFLEEKRAKQTPTTHIYLASTTAANRLRMTDTPTLPVMSLQQLLHIDNDMKKSNNDDNNEDDDILLDLTNLNISDINLELRQLRDDLKFDHQVMLQHLKNSRLILQRKEYAEKLSALNMQIEDMKIEKEKREMDKQQQKQALKNQVTGLEEQLNDLKAKLELLRKEKISAEVTAEIKHWRNALKEREEELINVEREIVSVEQELELIREQSNDYSAGCNISRLSSFQDRILLEVLNVELNKDHTGCFVGETTFIELKKAGDKTINFTDDIKNKAWEALKQDYEKLDLL